MHFCKTLAKVHSRYYLSYKELYTISDAVNERQALRYGPLSEVINLGSMGFLLLRCGLLRVFG